MSVSAVGSVVAGLCMIVVNHLAAPVTLHGCIWRNADSGMGWECVDADDYDYRPPLTIQVGPHSWSGVDDADEYEFRLWDDWKFKGVDVHWRDPCPGDLSEFYPEKRGLS